MPRCEKNRVSRSAPSGEAPKEKIQAHGDADECEDIQRLAFCGGDCLLEGVEKFLRDVHGVTFFLYLREEVVLKKAERL